LEGHEIDDIFFIADLLVLCILSDGSLALAGGGLSVVLAVECGHAAQLKLEIPGTAGEGEE
jgi:hypothetical protein